MAFFPTKFYHTCTPGLVHTVLVSSAALWYLFSFPAQGLLALHVSKRKRHPFAHEPVELMPCYLIRVYRDKRAEKEFIFEIAG